MKSGCVRQRAGEHSQAIGQREAHQSGAAHCHCQPGQDRSQRQRVVSSPRPTQAIHELSPVLDSDAVKEHDEADVADHGGRRGPGRKRTDCQTGEQNGSHSQREPLDVDLPQRIPQPDGEEHRQQLRGFQQSAEGIKHSQASLNRAGDASATASQGIQKHIRSAAARAAPQERRRGWRSGCPACGSVVMLSELVDKGPPARTCGSSEKMPGCPTGKHTTLRLPLHSACKCKDHFAHHSSSRGKYASPTFRDSVPGMLRNEGAAGV